MTAPVLSPFPSRSQVSQTPEPPKRKRSKIRAFFGFIGELLITAGLFLLLYVVWQLWWTTFIVDGEKAAIVQEFQMEHPVDGYTDIRRYDDPPSVGDVAIGEVYGVFHVPQWDWVELPLAQGVDQWILDSGNAGHYPDTQQVGEIGNFAVAAHRNTYGNGFRLVETLQEGHLFIIETAEAYIVYKMTDHQVVLPDATDVLLPVPNEPGVEPTKRIMTMTTCHPEWGNTERFIVWSEMDYWVHKDDGMPDIMKDKP